MNTEYLRQQGETILTIWLTPPPEPGVIYQVTRDEWNADYTERRILEFRLDNFDPDGELLNALPGSETTPTPGDIRWHEVHPDGTIDVTDYNTSPEAKAISLSVIEAYGLVFPYLFEFPPGEVVVHRYLANAEGKKYSVDIGGGERDIAGTIERYPWPVVS